MWWLVLVLLLLVLAVIWYCPNLFFTCLNSLFWIDPVPRHDKITSSTQTKVLFPVSELLEQNWKEIRQEGLALAGQVDPSTNYLNQYRVTLPPGTTTNWTTLALKLFGQEKREYWEQCPTLARILENHPEIKSCIYSIMPPGKVIEPHIGPYDGLLRYQLPLLIPPGECYLYVEDERKYWVEGEGFIFDETLYHGAVNLSQEERLVLLIDLERPYQYGPLRWLNSVMIDAMGLIS